MGMLLLVIGLAGAAIVMAAMLASIRRGAATGLRPTEPESVKRVRQRARDYIASGALPRWD